MALFSRYAGSADEIPRKKVITVEERKNRAKSKSLSGPLFSEEEIITIGRRAARASRKFRLAMHEVLREFESVDFAAKNDTFYLDETDGKVYVSQADIPSGHKYKKLVKAKEDEPAEETA